MGTEECGPGGNDVTNNNYFKVKIFMQDKYSYGGTEKIRRDVNCHLEVNFDLKAVTGNMNRQVNDTQTVNNRIAMPTH